MQGEDVGLLQGLGIDHLFGGDGGQRPDAVPQPGRGLELQIVGRRLHVRGQAVQHLAAAAAQEQVRLLHQLPIGAQADQADAGGAAAADLVEHAGTGPALIDIVRAGAQQERLLQGVQGAVHRPGGGEGAEILPLDGMGAPMLADLWRVVVPADQDLGKALVVPQQNVEPRLEGLDQIDLEEQGLGLGAGGDEHHGPGQMHHVGDALGVEAPLGVLDHPLLQGPGLAHIEHLPALAQHAVDTGAVRQALHLVGDQIRAGQPGARFGPGRVDGRRIRGREGICGNHARKIGAADRAANAIRAARPRRDVLLNRSGL